MPLLLLVFSFATAKPKTVDDGTRPDSAFEGEHVPVDLRATVGFLRVGTGESIGGVSGALAALDMLPPHVDAVLYASETMVLVSRKVGVRVVEFETVDRQRADLVSWRDAGLAVLRHYDIDTVAVITHEPGSSSLSYEFLVFSHKAKTHTVSGDYTIFTY